MSEAERDRIRERIATVKQDQKARGRYLGGILPFGWQLGADGALVAIPAQQEAIRRMRELRAAGTSLRAIAAAMQTAGHRLSHEAVRGILARTA